MNFAVPLKPRIAMADEPTSIENSAALERALHMAFMRAPAPPKPPEPPEPDDSRDDTRLVGGRYRLGDEIARGGMGIVRRAVDLQLGRVVAMKTLRAERIDHAPTVARFIDEARIAGQLQHPGVVPIYDAGKDSHGHPFFTMKLVTGRTLAAIVAERKQRHEAGERAGTTTTADLLRIFEQVCQTLAYAHSHQVVHRDLKPANVIVGKFGEVHVLDWGVAKVLEPAAPDQAVQSSLVIDVLRERSEVSGIGTLVGTPAYMPPEQAIGIVSAIDARSDVFSLGAILCEILTGQPPYTLPTSMECLELAAAAKLDETRNRLKTCGADAELIALALDCLSPLRSDRPRDASELAERMADYRAATAERLRTAQMAVEREHIKAVHARQSGRRVVLIAFVIVIAVILASVLVVRAMGQSAGTYQPINSSSEAHSRSISAAVAPGH